MTKTPRRKGGNYIVTGGAGLVGASMCARLLERGARVLCLDDLSLGTARHIEEFSSSPDFHFEKCDVAVPGWHRKLGPHLGENHFDAMIHLAANSDISLGHEQPEMDCRKTFTTTFECLRATLELGIKNFLFASTSAVYGAEPVFPTPEAAANMHPVSIYGAGKLASEAFISAFVENYGLSAWIFRFGNVVGKRLTHGVILDFIGRLRENPAELKVLGNGLQTKTYIDVEDCVDGMLLAFEKSPAGKTHSQRLQVFNLSTQGTTQVKQIAEEAVKVVAGGKAQIKYGTAPIGWVGDVAKTSLSVDRIHALGWKPKLDSHGAVMKAIHDYHAWSG